MANKKQVEEAVRGLDDANDAHWTGTGLPSVDAVSAALGERVTRDDIAGVSDRVRQIGGVSVRPGVAAKPMEGDPAEPPPGGAVDRDPDTGGLVESTAASQIRAASTERNYVPSKEGPEPEELFEMLEKVAAAASSPRYRRNQILGQIRLLWANEGKNARDAQNKMEGRIERREEKREAREQAAAWLQP